ncbi:hypothetical protein [Methanoplanus endosymbiosus]|uniref:Uncharacterized protein n=1 Tax=Methanoplanus endosymbiosus TaxID=33865 RepID=A0A9E7PNQ6_9EURY|nr:hypothetical protein [Methanoplanus endosymbiosus]UUX92274.1 hypothetical protein L6E24_13145 [Methanoplanus endosymbiosus]
MEHFDFDDYLDAVDQKRDLLGKSDFKALCEKTNFVSHRCGGRAYFLFEGDGSEYTLRITRHHKVHKRLLGWICTGLFLGITSVVIIPLGLFYSYNNGFLENSGLFITYPVFVISTLVIIKGWLFLKDVDSSLEKFNWGYVFLVAILVVELIAIFIFSILKHGASPLF